MIKTVLFDLDDTLIDTRVYAEIYPTVLRMVKLRQRWTEAEMETVLLSKGLRKNVQGRFDSGETCQKLGLLNEYYPILEKHIQIRMTLKRDVRRVFSVLEKKGIRVGIVSNSLRRTILLYVQKYRLKVDFVFSSEDAGCRKSDEKFWKRLVQQWKIVPAETMVVGDDYQEDFLIPRKLGFLALHLKPGEGLQKVLKIIS